MNLGTAATIVGQRLGVSAVGSTADGLAIRAFLTTWHNTLWRAYLWKDSICEFVTQANPANAYVPTSNYMPTKNRLVLPPAIDKVLGVRFKYRALNVQRPMFFYRANYAAFFQSGYAAEFELLSSCVWEFDTAQTLGLSGTNAADNNQPITLDELAADEITIVRNVYALQVAGAPILSSDLLQNFIKPATQGNISCGVFGGTSQIVIAPNTLTYLQAGGVGLIYLNALVSGTAYTFIAGLNEVGGTFTNGNVPVNGLTFGQQITFISTNVPNNPTVAVNGQANQPFTGTVQTEGTSGYANPTIISLSPTQTEAPKSQRIQLVGTPQGKQANENLYVLGKRTIPRYVADSDVPGVEGFTEILIPLAYYFFKNRDEQGGTADATAALVEAVGPTYLTNGIPGGLLKGLISEEVNQAAYNTRLIPSDGFGNSGYDFPVENKCDPYSF